MTQNHSVPRCHHDGWTPDVQTIFLETLATSGSVRDAARAVGKSPAAAYKRRAHANGAAFRAEWTAAIGICVEQIRETAIDRAVNGRLMPVFRNGVQTGEKLVFNDRLLIALMRLYDAPAYHAERAAAAQAAINPVVPPLSRAELEAQFEAALDKLNRDHAARAAEAAAFALADAAAQADAALQAADGDELGVSKESPKAADDGGWVPFDDGPHPSHIFDPAVSNASPTADDAAELSVSKESPKPGNAAGLGVSKESPNAENAAELGVSKESQNSDEANACGVWTETPRLSSPTDPRRNWRPSG